MTQFTMPQRAVGIIGYGNMGGAIARGILASETLCASFTVGAYDLNDAGRQGLEDAGGRWWTDPAALAADCDLILLAVKPYQIRDVINVIRPALAPDKGAGKKPGKTLISIAAGQPLSALRAALDGACPAVQAMPNTPALVGDGVFGLCFDDPSLPAERKEEIHALFAALGGVFVLPESKMNALTAVTGCGPAYVFDLMDALMEAAVTVGFTRKDAGDMVVRLFRGSARMVEETGLHPAVLHAQVTSPGGATIAGTNQMARSGVRGALIDAVLAARARAEEMEKE